MESVGTICKLDNNIAYIIAAADPYLIEKQNIKKCTVRYDDGRYISAEQRKKIYATISDISMFTGNEPEYEKELQKFFFVERTGEEYFSLASCSVTMATRFISHLIDFCFEHNIGTRDTLLNRAEDITRYLYSCLLHRKCAVCNNKAEIHHCEGSRVGMGFDRRKIDNVGRYAIALCRKCHNQAHSEAERDFLDRHHIYGIKLDKYLCDKLGI